MSPRLRILALLLLAPAALHAQGVLTPGRITPGTIAAADPANEDGQHYNDWRVALRSRHRYRVTMRSRAFDSYLAVGRGQGASFTSTVTDDDGGGNNDASLVFTPATDADYTVRARPLNSSERGAYTLAVTDEGEVQPLRAQAI